MCFVVLISLNVTVLVPVAQWELAAGTERLLETEVTPGTEQAHEMLGYSLGPLGTVLLT